MAVIGATDESNSRYVILGLPFAVLAVLVVFVFFNPNEVEFNEVELKTRFEGYMFSVGILTVGAGIMAFALGFYEFGILWLSNVVYWLLVIAYITAVRAYLACSDGARRVGARSCVRTRLCLVPYRNCDYSRFMKHAIDTGDIPTVDYLACACLYSPTRMHFRSACESGRADLLDWYVRACETPPSREDLETSFSTALRGDHAEVVEWLWERLMTHSDFESETEIAVLAVPASEILACATTSPKTALRLLPDCAFMCSDADLDRALQQTIQHKLWDVAQCLANTSETRAIRILDAASRAGEWDVVKSVLLKEGPKLSTLSLVDDFLQNAVVDSGRVDVLRALLALASARRPFVLAIRVHNACAQYLERNAKGLSYVTVLFSDNYRRVQRLWGKRRRLVLWKWAIRQERLRYEICCRVVA